ncbi:AraC family transcriptional regulator [Vibrio salinus]|uniref:AraC family transcriptional regulator n=1 Tax=Vibrio salinus TaxID=2899784 RepID=UPI001E2B87CC|nr:AraC family transcriptional regulator [Vibrio salinus]MCE0496007.1 AraC family transcriptional regulator [Vibrio salinus]
MKQANHFQFTNRLQLNNVAMLSATMSDFSYSKHAHEEYSIGLTLQGRQDFFCHDSFHKSSPGCVMFFNPEDIHDGHSGIEQELEYVMLYIHPDEVGPIFQTLGYKGNGPLRLKDRVFNDPVLRYRIESMTQSLKSGNRSQIEYENELYLLAQAIVSHDGSLHLPTSGLKVDSLLIKAKDFIIANLSNDISIDQIASAANISKFHFIRKFRAQFGITPHQYVLNCRINQARKMLQIGDSATQAAVESGFADVSHLNRNFKKVFGMTPKQFQRQWSR